MKELNDYLLSIGVKKNHFARALGVEPSYLYSVLNGKLPCSKKLATRIEEVTAGAFTVEQLVTKQ
jgi:plasmid maintenance system antidote protein VapI